MTERERREAIRTARKRLERRARVDGRRRGRRRLLPMVVGAGLAVVAVGAGCDGTSSGKEPRPPHAAGATAQPAGVPSPAAEATGSARPGPGAPGASAAPSATGMPQQVVQPLPGGFLLVDDSDRLDSASPFIAVIVPEPKAAKFYFGDHGAAESYWTPTVPDALAFAEVLRQEVPRRNAAIGARLAAYRYQLVGLVVGGRRLLYVNAFCSPPPSWRERPVIVDDGGDCYFQISFDPATKRIARLTVNGEA